MDTLQFPLSNIQQELLKIYAAGVPDQHLPELKNVIARFLFEKARKEADQVWDAKGYSDDTVEEWLNED
ncbi:MAG: hypothetical protein AAF849_08655 [Bacteroidota bacterium]